MTVSKKVSFNDVVEVREFEVKTNPDIRYLAQYCTNTYSMSIGKINYDAKVMHSDLLLFIPALFGACLLYMRGEMDKHDVANVIDYVKDRVKYDFTFDFVGYGKPSFKVSCNLVDESIYTYHLVPCKISCMGRNVAKIDMFCAGV